jgi:5-hydroxyisourate hydrolase
MSVITTHILDTATGRPASGVDVVLEEQRGADEWTAVGRGLTDADGRLRTLMPEGEPLEPGTYRLIFHTRAYFQRSDTVTFYPHVVVVFDVAGGESHYHVPLLLSPFGYSTYRGS